MSFGVGGFGATRGQEIHTRIQARKKRTEPDYQSEVPIVGDFGFLQIGGRIDGLYHRKPPCVEEIKTTTSIKRLVAALQDPHHIYRLQVLMYGYLYALENGVWPECRLLLASSYDESQLEIAIEIDTAFFESWLEGQLNCWRDVIAGQAIEQDRRRRVGEGIRFPFKQYRKGQFELCQKVAETALAQRQLMVQAPTGLGKTMAALFPMLQQALLSQRRVIYVTPKNSQHRVVLDAVQMLIHQGHNISATVVSARQKACLKDEVICEPGYCEHARDYYDRLYGGDVISNLINQGVLDLSLLRDTGIQSSLCPYELAKDTTPHVDIVVCDYNYIFTAGLLFHDEETKDLLIVDEAHNLPDRARDYLSPVLRYEQVRETESRIQGNSLASAVVKRLTTLFRHLRQSGDTFRVIDPPIEQIRLCAEEAGKMAAEHLARHSGVVHHEDPVIGLFQIVQTFYAQLDKIDERFRVVYEGGNRERIQIICCDASEFLRQVLKRFQSVVCMSATLKPFKFFEHQLGLEANRTDSLEFGSSFPVENRLILIVPQVSSHYRERTRQAPRYAELIERVISLRKGNYFVFFPSYAFLNQVAKPLSLPGYKVLKQIPEMTAFDLRKMVMQLKRKQKNRVILAVQGGSLAEGLDFPGEEICGAIIVGPGLPAFSPERELLRGYFNGQGLDGFAYAYVFPGMARAIQAAGRVIRTETDKGCIICADRRYLQAPYQDALPADWFVNSPKELVSSTILQDLEGFWKGEKQMWTVLGIPNCDKVRAARKWFKANGIDYEFRDLRVSPLTRDQWMELVNQDQGNQLINRKGPVFRGLKDTETWSPERWADQLRATPTLMKRPAILAENKLVITGFDEQQYEKLVLG